MSRVLVTGGSRGIGRSVVRAFTLAGDRVLFSYGRDAQAAASTCRAAPGAVAIQHDLRAVDAPEALVAAAIEHLGRIDVLVNCAGIYPHTEFLETSAEELGEVLQVNFMAAYRLMQLCGRVMAEDETGTIINITSINAFSPEEGMSAYDASKAALAQATRTAALELGRCGVRVNAIAPGLVDAPGIWGAVPERCAAFVEHAPLGRLVAPDDVANVALFLASPGSSAITGQTLVVDAGVSLAGYMAGSVSAKAAVDGDSLTSDSTG